MVKEILQRAWAWGVSGFNTPDDSGSNVVDVDAMSPWNPGFGGISIQDGNKFFGGLGLPTLVLTDYWSLRLHSAKLFKENLYARGLIRRLVTNEINVGLSLEATPNRDLLGMTEKARNVWAEDVENRFQMWARNPQKVCDFKKQDTFGALQRIARREALIEGDILIVLRQSRKTGLPAVQFIPGHKVRTPIAPNPREGNRIIHGVEVDKNDVQVAYWIDQADNTSKRLPAFGERSGRRIAWMAYGTDKRASETRGEPMLSLILQSLKEIDRYRDSAQRQAVINSIIAMAIMKDEDKPSTKPITGGAVRKNSTTVTDPDGTTRDFNIASALPGTIVEELQQGESIKTFGSEGTDINFGVFESALIQAVAWANEIPPEVLTLAFQSNYSASRGAVNEFKMYLDKSRSERADEFDIPIYTEWLLTEVLRGKIKAPGLLEAWRDPQQYDIFGAWVSSDWAGAIKPSVDIKKEAQGYGLMIDMGGITRSRMSRELTGMKFSKVVEQLKTENEQLAEAKRPLLELAAEFNIPVDDVLTASADKIIEAAVEESLRLVAEGEG